MSFAELLALLQSNDSIDEIRFIKLPHNGEEKFHVVPNSKKLARSFGEAFLLEREFAELRRRFSTLLFANTDTYPEVKKKPDRG